MELFLQQLLNGLIIVVAFRRSRDGGRKSGGVFSNTKMSLKRE